jgi:hypothetical protein
VVTIWHRRPDLSRGALVQAQEQVVIVERHNAPDTVQITAPKAELAPLCQAGHGALVVDSDGRVISGVSVQWLRSSTRTATLTLEADTAAAWRRLAYAAPGSAWPAQAAAYDRRTGPAETIALAYLDVNLGPGALVPRRLTGLSVPTSAGRGVTQTRTARFNLLGALVSEILEPDGLRWRIVQPDVDDPVLTVEVTQPAPVPAARSLGIPGYGGPTLLSQWSYEVAAPEATVALLGAQGELASRLLRERADTSGALTAWGRREVFVDQRQTDDVGEVDKAGDDAVADAQPMIRVTADIDQPLPVGALVTVDLDGVQITERVRTLTTTITPARTTYKATIASAQGADLTIDQRRLLALDKQARKVAAQ